MRHAAFLLLFIFAVAGVPSAKMCTYQDVLDYLNLTADNSVFKLTRPVLDYTHPTVVELDILLYAILAVIEKTQTFIPFLWATMRWNDERISWDPSQFCGINRISIPREMLWRPDLFIYEILNRVRALAIVNDSIKTGQGIHYVTHNGYGSLYRLPANLKMDNGQIIISKHIIRRVQKDESPQNPYMCVTYDGMVISEEDIKVVSTCKMDVHKFPFDTQRCNITIGSAIHSVDEIRLLPFSNSSRATQFSREVMKTQGEWEFLHLTVGTYNFTFHNREWEQLVYTFTIKRRPLLHVINFLLPILFFLSLDLASYFISDHRGEKLGFKVTVLLAISVLLLILNDILPSMSNKTPLVATYCIVIFALMLLSLLETILVTHLMEQDNASQEKLRLRDNCEDKQEKVQIYDCSTEEKRQTCCSCICKVSDDEKQHEMLPAAEEVDNSIQSGESDVLLLILKEMKDLQQTLNLHFGFKKEEGKSSQWATRINRAFFIFYVTTVSLFIPFIFMEWNT